MEKILGISLGAVSIKGGKWNPDRVDGVGMG